MFEENYRNYKEYVMDNYIESIPLKQPLYKKGEITIYSYSKDMNYTVAKVLLNRLGLEIITEVYENAFLVKCPNGKEIESAENVIKKYSEFFESYDREDIRINYINDKIINIVDKVENINDFFGRLNKKNINTKEYNDHIDNIIRSLIDIKIK